MKEIICRAVFHDDAQAQDLLDQITARMTNTSVGDPGGPGERTSYVRMEDAETGAPIEMQHVDEHGIVREGEYIAPDPYPEFVMPTGAHDSYPATRLDGEPTQVMYEGEAWENTSGGVNSWEPGVAGWTKVSEL